MIDRVPMQQNVKVEKPTLADELTKMLGEKQKVNQVKQKYSNTYQKKPTLNEGMNASKTDVFL